MSVAGIFGSSFVNYAAQSVQSRMQQVRKDFQQLGQDLQSGNLSAAQSDFAAMQKSGPQSNSSSPTQNNSLISQLSMCGDKTPTTSPLAYAALTEPLSGMYFTSSTSFPFSL